MQAYYEDGTIIQVAPKSSIMVASKDDLDSITAADLPPTSIAYTAGFKNMWQLDADGVWQPIIEEEGE